MTRLEKLNQCLEIARKHKNTYMEGNLLREIKREMENPSSYTYKNEEEEETTEG